jgi:hypothetical protein
MKWGRFMKLLDAANKEVRDGYVVNVGLHSGKEFMDFDLALLPHEEAIKVANARDAEPRNWVVIPIENIEWLECLAP